MAVNNQQTLPAQDGRTETQTENATGDNDQTPDKDRPCHLYSARRSNFSSTSRISGASGY